MGIVVSPIFYIVALVLTATAVMLRDETYLFGALILGMMAYILVKAIRDE